MSKPVCDHVDPAVRVQLLYLNDDSWPALHGRGLQVEIDRVVPNGAHLRRPVRRLRVPVRGAFKHAPVLPMVDSPFARDACTKPQAAFNFANHVHLGAISRGRTVLAARIYSPSAQVAVRRLLLLLLSFH